MSEPGPGTLVRLSDTGRTIATGSPDIRGRTVKDSTGEDIGHVEELLVDPDEEKVRFLLVEHGGILGFGAVPSYIPIDAVSRVTDDTVYVDRTRHHIAGAPRYDPELADLGDYYSDLYGYYGYPPFWTTGYLYPGFPPRA